MLQLHVQSKSYKRQQYIAQYMYLYMYIQEVYEKLYFVIFIYEYMYYTMLFSNSIFRDYFWEQHYSSDEMDGLENIEDGDDTLSEFSLPEQVEELIEKGKYKNVERIVKQVRNTYIHPVHVQCICIFIYPVHVILLEFHAELVCDGIHSLP